MDKIRLWPFHKKETETGKGGGTDQPKPSSQLYSCSCGNFPAIDLSLAGCADPDMDAMARKVYKHVTSGELVELSDGHKENHKKLQTRNPDEIKNLVKWILAK